jgi:predicted ATPase/DNA-binding CsgD family transcriptional regulator
VATPPAIGRVRPVPAPLTLLEWALNVWPVGRPAAQRPYRALPVHASRFVGRQRELAEVGRLVGRSRLVTLTGAAGSGKTRLALEVAVRVGGSRPDGPCLVELASLSEGELLPHAFASALQIREVKARPVLDMLQEKLAGYEGLIIVDNCEHLIEACAELVDRLLRRCPGLTVLATSREPLHVDGEVVWLVPTFSLPNEGASMRDTMRAESVALFVARARQAAPRFEITASNAAEVGGICRRLDGLPLAIELAAARVAALDLASISEQLNDRFRFLTGGFRTAPQRQRTLRAAVDWSYELLTSAERQVFDRLAVFAGGFDTEGARAVCPGGSVLAGQVVDLLGRLIDKSLVVAVDLVAEPRRYRMLETLRAYGLERLREEGQLEMYTRRHADYLDSLSGSSVEAWDSAEWLLLMKREVDNFREALTWSRSADGDLHLRLAAAYAWMCMRSGFIGEGRMWLGPALERGGEGPAALAQANLAMAFLAWRQSDFDAADRFASEAVRIRRVLGDEMNLGWTIGALAFVRIATSSARGAIEEQLAIARRLGVRQMEAESLLNLGGLEAIEMDLDHALDHLSQSLALYEGVGPDIPPSLCNVLGMVLLILHRPEEARPFVARGLLTRLKTHDVIDMTGSLDASAELAFELGAPERAMRIKGASDAIRRRAGSSPTRLAAASRERWVARAEKALGRVAHKAWLEGGRLNPEEAGAYALSPFEQPPPRPDTAAGTTLSGRENQVAELVAGGMTNDEIASRLRLSRRTVEAHLDHIRTKLGVRSRVEVATWVAAKSTPPAA